jgi:uncharacterized protein (DUF433 family)
LLWWEAGDSIKAERAVVGWESLIPEYIEENPDRPGPGHARLKESAVPVWALIGHLPVHNGREDLVAADYDVPLEAVQAAVAFYRENKCEIDAELMSKRASSV